MNIPPHRDVWYAPAMAWTKHMLHIAAIFIVLQLLACRRSVPVTDPPGQISARPIPASHAATSPATNSAPQAYHNDKFRIYIEYPANWKAKPSNDYELLIEPTDGLQGCTFSLDIPDLPPHIPGFIPISSVYDGYLSDLKKQWTEVKATVTTPTIPEAHARLAVCAGKNKGTPMVEHALLLVHGDHVYILRATGSAQSDKDFTPVFDSICKSLQWK